MSLIGLLVGLILIALVFWAVRMIAAAFSLPAQIVTVIHVVLVILVVLWLLQALGLWGGGPVLEVR